MYRIGSGVCQAITDDVYTTSITEGCVGDRGVGFVYSGLVQTQTQVQSVGRKDESVERRTEDKSKKQKQRHDAKASYAGRS